MRRRKPAIGRDSYKVVDPDNKVLAEEALPQYALTRAQKLAMDATDADLIVRRESIGAADHSNLYHVVSDGKTVTTYTLDE